MQTHDPDGIRLAPDIPYVDIWPPGTITEASIQAYKRLQEKGELKLQSVVTGRKTGVTTIRYLSNCPDHGWALAALKEARGKIILECMRDAEQIRF